MTLADHLPVARVAVDTGVPHLDRAFDYAVPQTLDAAAPGTRVRVRFAGRLVGGFVLERVATSEHQGTLAPLAALVSPEPVLTAEIATLAAVLAQRSAGTVQDVLRLAVPARHARVEAEPAQDRAAVPVFPEPHAWSRYQAGPSFVSALRDAAPRAVWNALPGPTWPGEIAVAVQAAAAAGRGVVVVVPDSRDADRVSAALSDPASDPACQVPHVVLRADLGPAERYRRWLAVLRGQVQVVVGTRAAAFAPVRDLGLVVLWDDGDDLLVEPRAPYVHAREVLLHRAHLAGAAALLGGFARTAEAQLLVDTGWAAELSPARDVVRLVAPRVTGTTDADASRDPAARQARVPHRAFEAARAAFAQGAPVLVQVPRRGYVPALACQRDRTPARCESCAGPLQASSGHAVPACAWCGHLAGQWQCPQCQGRALRAVAVGARRTAEELGRAFPGVTVRTSGRDEVLATVADRPDLVVATPGAEPVADGGYGAVLLLDAWAVLGRPDLRAGEEALRRWFAAAALTRPGGQVVVVADQGLPAVQALVRWDPAWAARRELDDRAALGFPPATRIASISGAPAAVAQVVSSLSLGEVLGPVPHGDGERALVRVPRRDGPDLARALSAVLATRSARKDEPVKVVLDPHELL